VNDTLLLSEKSKASNLIAKQSMKYSSLSMAAAILGNCNVMASASSVSEDTSCLLYLDMSNGNIIYCLLIYSLYDIISFSQLYKYLCYCRTVHQISSGANSGHGRLLRGAPFIENSLSSITSNSNLLKTLHHWTMDQKPLFFPAAGIRLRL